MNGGRAHRNMFQTMKTLHSSSLTRLLLLLLTSVAHGDDSGPSQVGIVELHHHILVHLITARREGVLPEGATLPWVH